MPRFNAIFLIITLASIGLPGLCGFVGEFLVLNGTFGAYHTWAGLPTFFPHPKVLAVIATTGVIFAAMYMLYLFQKVMFGPLSNSRNRDLPDLNGREVAVFVPVVIMAFLLGLYPAPFLSTIDPAVKRTVAQFQAKYAVAIEDGDAPKMMPEPSAAPEKAAPEKPSQGAVGAPEGGAL